MKSSFSTCKVVLVRDREIEYDTMVKKDEDIYQAALRLGYGEFAEEVFGMFCFNTRGKIEAYFEVSRGNISGTMVHPREVFKRAILCNATTVAFVHNHPSGDPEESGDDIALTKRLVEAGELLCIKVLDHIVIGDRRYRSMRHEGIIV